jgi:TolA-binding protein
MSDACREVQDALAIEPRDERVQERIAAHVARCATCQARAADHARLVEALRGDDTSVDEVTRARWLAQLAPSVDELATRYAGTGRRAERARWLPVLAAAAAVAAIAVGAALATDEPAPAGVASGTAPSGSAVPPPAPAPAPAPVDLAVLRPYIVSGPTTDDAATTLLAGRFTVLAVAPDQLVRVEVGADARIAAIGPARVTIRAIDAEVHLDVAGGTVLVEHTAGRPLAISAGGVAIRAQNARFAVDAADAATTAVFVDRGEIVLDGAPLGAGQWRGPADRRSVALVASLRDHGNAIAPPPDPSGVIAVGGTGSVVTESGAVLGAAPLWARVPVGEMVVVVTAVDAGRPDADGSMTRGRERRLPVEVERGGVVHVPRATASAAGGEPGTRPTRIRATTTPTTTTASEEMPVDESPAAMYAAAEAALRAGDRDEAQAIWTRLIDRHPKSSHASSAMYDLAGLARARGDIVDAQAWLTRLLDRAPPDSLREPALYLSCRLDADAHPSTAAACFERFRRNYPDSAHDAEVLAWLAAQAEKSEGCAAARPIAEEYLRRHPGGAFADRAATLAACTAEDTP